MVELLLQQGANIAHQNRRADGGSALHEAVAHKPEAVADLLMRAGASPLVENARGGWAGGPVGGRGGWLAGWLAGGGQQSAWTIQWLGRPPASPAQEALLAVVGLCSSCGSESSKSACFSAFYRMKERLSA